MRLKLILLALGITILAASASLWNYSRIQMSVPNISGEYTITLENQADGKATVTKTSSKSFSKIVSKGSYRVIVTQGQNSRFFLIDTAPFLATTSVTAELQTQIARSYIGNSPGDCFYLIANVALSSTCTGSQSHMTLHTPATATQASYNQDYITIRGRFMDSLETAGGTIVLSQSIGDSGPLLHLFTGKLEPAKSTELSGLKAGVEYRLSNYKAGFLVHNFDFSDVQYYSAFGAAAQSVTFEAAQTKASKPSAVATNNQATAVAYFSERSEEDQGKNIAEIVLSTPGKATQHFTTQGHITKLMFCSTQTLCALNSLGSSLQVYKLEDKGIDNDFDIKDVSDFLLYQNQIVAAQGKSVYRINPDDQSGFQEYSFGAYNFCGFSPAPNGYVLCIAGAKNGRALLRLDETAAIINSGAIDQQLASLSTKTDIINQISAYGRFITVVPKGDLIMNWTARRLEPDPVKQATINGQINATINELGIDRSKYQISITAPLGD
jgi:hypothetical protein